MARAGVDLEMTTLRQQLRRSAHGARSLIPATLAMVKFDGHAAPPYWLFDDTSASLAQVFQSGHFGIPTPSFTVSVMYRT
jgi:hypothetical protein